MAHHKVYIAIVCMAALAMAVVFNALPRTAYSELEKRELAQFPTFSLGSLASGVYAKEVSSWYSDTEPMRDAFMELSMRVKDAMGVSIGDDNVTFHATASPAVEDGAVEETDAAAEAEERSVGKYENKVTAEENAKIANRGIIIVGQGDNVRALMAYGGGAKGGLGYAKAANAYKEAFGQGVEVYCMVVPTAVDFYCPDKAKSRTNEQQPTINNIHSHLRPDVRAVDVYTALGKHAGEDIFFRTDHHWAPLGAYYAAQQFAHVAGVPFKPLSSYDRKVVRGYVGSMYGYSKDIALKNAPEDFVYHVPRGVDYTTTYIDYRVDRNYRVVGEGKPHKGPFFHKYKDGSGGTYCTFMGGDMRIAQVRTSTPGKRRLLILKDSFGNALPGYLFYSFEEIHVVDFRYFTRNMRGYVAENKITDILFANNIFNAYSNKICKKYVGFLNQRQSAAAHIHSEPKADGGAAAKQAKPAVKKVSHAADTGSARKPLPATQPEPPAQQTEPVLEPTPEQPATPPAEE